MSLYRNTTGADATIDIPVEDRINRVVVPVGSALLVDTTQGNGPEVVALIQSAALTKEN